MASLYIAENRMSVPPESEIKQVPDKVREVWERKEKNPKYTIEDYERDKKARKQRN